MTKLADKTLLIGRTFTTKSSGVLIITDYINNLKVHVRFVDTGYETVCALGKIKAGGVKDRLLPSVYGVGFIGCGNYNSSLTGNKSHTPAYKTWKSMLRRCYSKKYQSYQPTYIGCSVCEEWHNFQVFAEWFYEQDYNGNQLDKDMLVSGCRIYSRDTCSMISHQMNSELAHAKNYRVIDKNGVEISVYNLDKYCREHDIKRHRVVTLP